MYQEIKNSTNKINKKIPNINVPFLSRIQNVENCTSQNAAINNEHLR